MPLLLELEADISTFQSFCKVLNMYRDAINGPKNRQFIHSSKCTFHNLCKVPLGTFSSDAGTELSNSWPKCCSVSFDNSAFLEADNYVLVWKNNVLGLVEKYQRLKKY